MPRTVNGTGQLAVRRGEQMFLEERDLLQDDVLVHAYTCHLVPVDASEISKLIEK